MPARCAVREIAPLQFTPMMGMPLLRNHGESATKRSTRICGSFSRGKRYVIKAFALSLRGGAPILVQPCAKRCGAALRPCARPTPLGARRARRTPEIDMWGPGGWSKKKKTELLLCPRSAPPQPPKPLVSSDVPFSSGVAYLPGGAQACRGARMPTEGPRLPAGFHVCAT